MQAGLAACRIRYRSAVPVGSARRGSDFAVVGYFPVGYVAVGHWLRACGRLGSGDRRLPRARRLCCRCGGLPRWRRLGKGCGGSTSLSAPLQRVWLHHSWLLWRVCGFVLVGALAVGVGGFLVVGAYAVFVVGYRMGGALAEGVVGLHHGRRLCSGCGGHYIRVLSACWGGSWEQPDDRTGQILTRWCGWGSGRRCLLRHLRCFL